MDSRPRALIIGAGSDDLQQGGELDYATLEIGSTLHQRGFATILVDDNPFSASLDTTEAIDFPHILPLTTQSIVDLINQYHPVIIVPTLGGRKVFELLQTVAETGILTQKDIKIAGMPESTVRQINNPVLFNQTLRRLKSPTKKMVTVDNFQDALEMAHEVGFPVVVRSVFPRNIRMRRIVQDSEELRAAVSTGIQLSRSGQVLVQQSLAGLKEIEALVMRDASGTMMLLGMAEDIDPIGIHAGDSVTVLPSQTLLDRQIQDMRNTAFAITRRLRIVGINHIQFAFDDQQNRFYVIKNSPYFDRISSFVEIATGYPISRVVGNLYAGDLLRNIRLDHGLTKHTAVTEPVMDRTAVRMPIFPYAQLQVNPQTLSTQKKSVGTTIGIGRSLNEAILKAISDYQSGWHNGRSRLMHSVSDEDLDQMLIHPHAERFYSLIEAVRRGYSEPELAELTKIDSYYLSQIKHLVDLQKSIINSKQDPAVIQQAKFWGIDDDQIGDMLRISSQKVLQLRSKNQINRTYKEVDPSAGEFDQHTNTYYSTFEIENESHPLTHRPVVLMVAGGPRRLGNGSANDYLLGKMLREFKRHGYDTIVVNDNPNSVTLSHIYADKRYIEPLISEEIIDIIRIEQPDVVTIASNESELYTRLKAYYGDQLTIHLIPTDDQLEDVVSTEPLIEYNALYDGQYVYPLGLTAALQANDELNYRTVAKRFPTTLSSQAVKKVAGIGEQHVRKFAKPGLYQVLIKEGMDNHYSIEMSRPLPTTDVAFLSKVLHLDLPAVMVRLMLHKFSGKLLQQSVRSSDDATAAFYRALFPFKSLQIQEPATAAKVMGAEMQFISSVRE